MLGKYANPLLVLSFFVISCSTGETQPSQEPKAASSVETTEVAAKTVEAEPKTEVSKSASGHEIATFKVPEMDEAKIAGMIGALADDKGVLEAKPEKADGTLAVTFVPGETDPKQISMTLEKIAQGIVLDKIEAAQNGQVVPDGCGGCPKRKTCQDAH